MLAIGDRICILGDWDESETPPGKIPIRLRPGYVFGTGSHPTTLGFLEILQTLDLGRSIVLDVGCGSGILSIACAKLGAQEVYGKDISEDARCLAQENVLLNQVEDIVQISLGTYLPKGLPAGYMVDLVLCNVDSRDLVQGILQYSREILVLGGRLLFSCSPDVFPLLEYVRGYHILSATDIPGPGGGWKLVMLRWESNYAKDN